MAELSPEAHARLVWALMVILYSVFALRCWALRKVRDNYSFRSPRGISTMCIIATIIVTSALAGMVTWSLVGPYQRAVDSILEIHEKAKDDVNPITATPYLDPSSITTPSTLKIAAPTTTGSPEPTGDLDMVDISSTASLGGPELTLIVSADAADQTGTPNQGPQIVDSPPPGATIMDFDISTASPEQLAAAGITIGKRGLGAVSELSGTLSRRNTGKKKRDIEPPKTKEEADEIVKGLFADGTFPEGAVVHGLGSPGDPPLQQTDDKEADAAAPNITKEEADSIAKMIVQAGLEPPSGIPLTSDPEGREKLDPKKIQNGILQVEFVPYEHEDDRRKFETAFKVNFASMAVFYTAIWLAKASFLVFYFEFSSSLSSRTRRLLYASSVAMVATYGFTMLVHLMWCLPIEDNWNLQSVIQIRTCRSEIAPSIIAAVINVLTDLLLACTFFAIIRSIQSNRNDWRAASLILFTGCLTILVAIVRLACLCALMVDQNKELNEKANTHENGTTYIQQVIRESVSGYPEVEAILAAMATCLPALRALFRQSTGRSLLGSTRGGTQMTGPPTYRSNVGTQNGSAVNVSEKDLEGGPVSGFKFQ